MSTFDEFRSRKIKVFRNGDTWTAGKKMVLSNRVYRNYEQFLSQIAKDVPLTAGAVRKMYAIDGTPIKSLDDIRDGGMYVASGGDSFKRVPYLIEDDPVPDPLSKNKKDKNTSRPRQSYGILNSDINNTFNQMEKPLFSPSTKAFKVMVFVNGIVNEPLRLLLNHRNCRSFEHLVRHLSTILKLPSGQVRKIYDASTYKRLKGLHDLQDGMNLIAVTNDQIKKLPYQLVDPLFKAPSIPNETPTIAHFFPNGDPYHMGLSVSITRKRFSGLQRLLDHLNNQIELVTGKIQQIYSMEGDGTKVQKLEDIENGKGYILVANNDPLIRIKYNTKAIQISPSHGLGGITMKNEHMSRIRKVTDRWSLKQQKSMHEQTSFTESIKEERPQQQSNRGTPQPKNKVPIQTPRQKSAVSETVNAFTDGENGFDSENNDEIYGEKEVKQFSKKSNPQTPKTTGKSLEPGPTPNDRSVAVTPKTDLRSSATTPKIEVRSVEVTPKTELRSGAATSKTELRSGAATSKTELRSGAATSKTELRSGAANSKNELRSGAPTSKTELRSGAPTSKTELRSGAASSKNELRSGAASSKTELRSAIASPKALTRSAEASPKSVPRSSIASPKSVARSSVASPGAKSRLSSAGDQSSVEPDDDNDKTSRPQSKLKSTKGSIRGSKEMIKSQKGSNDQLSTKGSREQLKPSGQEELVRATSSGSQ